MINIDLQLFAKKDEDIDNEELDELDEENQDDEDIDKDEEKEDEIDEEADEDLEEVEEPKKKPLSKVEIALIKQKKANKEMKSKLLEYEQKEAEKELNKKKQQLVDKYIDKGFDEEEALSKAENDTKVEKLERELKLMKFERQAEKLESKYPEVTDKLDSLIEICNKTGWSLEKVCIAEFGVSKSYDARIDSEQEALLKKRHKSKPVSNNNTPLESIKFSAEDEAAYQFYIKKNSGVSRKQYRENVINVSNQKIPHDRWE